MGTGAGSYNPFGLPGTVTTPTGSTTYAGQPGSAAPVSSSPAVPPPPGPSTPGSQGAPYATQTPGFNGNGGAAPQYGTQSPSAFGTGQYVAPLFPINDQAITGAPTNGASTDYGLNSVWSNLSNELNSSQGQGAGMVRAATVGPASYQAALGQAANAQAAQGGYATSGPTAISTAGDAAFQAQQQALARTLATQANGGGVSPADLQLQQGAEQNIAQQLAVLGSQRGSGNAALAQRAAADQAAAGGANLNQQMGIQRAQETLQAQQALGSVLGTARGQAQSYNANQAQLDQQTALANAQNAQQATLANTGYSQQTALANQQAQNAMTSGNLAALNASNVGNAQLAQQAGLANQGAINAANAGNQQTQLANIAQQHAQQNAILGAQAGIANSDRAASLADQQLELQQMIAANQINEQGYAAAAQGNANLTSAVVGGLASLAQTGLQAAGKGSGASAASGAAAPSVDPNSYALASQQQLTPDQAAYWTALSDENLKTGIEGGNPMMRSFLTSYHSAMKSAPETKVDVNEGSGFRNPTYGKTPGTDTGGGIGSALGSLVGGALGTMVAPGIGTAVGAGLGGAAGKSIGSGIGGGPSGGGSVQTGAGSGVTVDESGWGQMPDAMPADGYADEMAVSDDREKDAVTSGNRGMQAFLQQANAQTNAQNSQGSHSNAFMQTGLAPSAQVDRQLPPGFGGYGGSGYSAPAYSMGGYGAQQPVAAPQFGGGSYGGDVYGGGVTAQGGYSVGGTQGEGLDTTGWLGSSPTAQMVAPAVVPQAQGGTSAHQYPGLGGVMFTPVQQAAPATKVLRIPGASLALTAQQQQRMTAPAGLTNFAALSDERQKSVDAGPSGVQRMLDQLHAYQYRYKDPTMPGAAPGEHLGVMAQDLQKSPLGASFVEKGDDGALRVNYGQAAGTMLAGQAMLNERLNQHDEMLKQLLGRKGAR